MKLYNLTIALRDIHLENYYNVIYWSRFRMTRLLWWRDEQNIWLDVNRKI